MDVVTFTYEGWPDVSTDTLIEGFGGLRVDGGTSI